jgi:hypothetical protein
MVDKANCGNDFSQFPLKKEYSFISDLENILLAMRSYTPFPPYNP